MRAFAIVVVLIVVILSATWMKLDADRARQDAEQARLERDALKVRVTDLQNQIDARAQADRLEAEKVRQDRLAAENQQQDLEAIYANFDALGKGMEAYARDAGRR